VSHRSAGDPGGTTATTGSIIIIIVMMIVITTTVATSAIINVSSGPAASSSSSSSVASSSSSVIPLPTAPESSTYQSCISDSNIVYCVEGNQTYYAPLSSSGIGNWRVTTSYPFESGTCVASGGYIYCIAGEEGGAPSDSVYFAQLSSSGIGRWTQTTSYPFALDYGPSCIASAGYVYCLGGNSTIAGTGGSDLVYYAPISSSGVGSWQQVGTYGYTQGVQVAVLNGPGPYVDLGSGPACVTSSGDAYCVGGAFCYATIAGPGCVADRFSYYAVLSSGIHAPPGQSPVAKSAWANTTSYPDQTSLDFAYQDVNSLSCVADSGYIYCVGGGPAGGGVNATYFAPLSSSGIGSWTATTDYPVGVASASCVTYSGYIYCINGIAALGPAGVEVPTTYYAPLSSSGIGAWLPTNDF
jgi:hypothetical protein